MLTNHLLGLLYDPKAEWAVIRDRNYTTLKVFTGHTLILALIPAIAGFIGTTQIGWEIGGGDPVKLTAASGYRIAFLYYLAMLFAVSVVGTTIHWMSKTYGAEQTLPQCMVLAAYSASPLFIIGIVEVYPILWLNLLLALPALGYTTYIFYTGVPIMMNINQERGFLFSSAVLGFGLVALVAMLAVTALLWGAGLAPVFTN